MWWSQIAYGDLALSYLDSYMNNDEIKRLAEEHNIKYPTLKWRLENDWPLEKALTAPVRELTPKKEKAPTERSIRRKVRDKMFDLFLKHGFKKLEEELKEACDDSALKFFKTYLMPFVPKDNAIQAPVQQTPAQIYIDMRPNEEMGREL